MNLITYLVIIILSGPASPIKEISPTPPPVEREREREERRDQPPQREYQRPPNYPPAHGGHHGGHHGPHGGHDQSTASNLFSSVRSGAFSFMKNVKDASSKVMETVSA